MGGGRYRGAGKRDHRYGDRETTVSDSIVVTPDPISAVVTVVDPTVILGSIVVTPDPISAVVTVVDPTVIISDAGVITVWARVNGVDVPNTGAVKKVVGSDVLTFIHEIELEKDDYYELVFAVEDISVYLDAIPISSVGPETPSAVLNVKKAKV